MEKIKNFALIFLLLFVFKAHANFHFNWLGATTSFITDGSTVLSFDPFVTHPSYLDFLFNREIATDPKLVANWFKKGNIKKIDAIFVNHSHFDHILDVLPFHDLNKANVYGTLSTVNYSLGQGIDKKYLKQVGHRDKFEFGKFKLTTLKALHSPHVLDITLFDGEMKKPTKKRMKIWNMLTGGSRFYYFEHPSGNIFYHPIARKSPYIKNYSKYKADILFLGIAARVDTADQIEKVIKPINPKVIIPLHWDNFYEPLQENPPHLPTVNMEEWMATIKKKIPNVKILMPKLAKWQPIQLDSK